MAKPSKTDDVDYELNTDSISSGKGHATPTRREREAANLRPLVSADRKIGDRRSGPSVSKAEAAAARNRAKVGMANGEEKYLGVRDKGPQRRYVRDYIDARFSIGEIMIPIMFAVVILTFINNIQLQTIAIYGLWAFFLVTVIDCVIVGFLVKRKLATKFGADKVQRGVAWYAAMRAVQLRAMRLPKPQVKRGAFPS